MQKKITCTLLARYLGFSIVFIACIAFTTTHAQVVDSSQNDSLFIDYEPVPAPDYFPEEVEGEFVPMLGVIALVGIAFIFICVGAGIVVSLLTLLFIFGLIGLGILSASVLVGIYKKSIEKGFKTLTVLTTTLGGVILGLLVSWILNNWLQWASTPMALSAGAVAGLLAGLLLGVLLFRIAQVFIAFLIKKLKGPNKPPILP